MGVKHQFTYLLAPASSTSAPHPASPPHPSLLTQQISNGIVVVVIIS